MPHANVVLLAGFARRVDDPRDSLGARRGAAAAAAAAVAEAQAADAADEHTTAGGCGGAAASSTSTSGGGRRVYELQYEDLTKYVVTRAYRAPEVLLSQPYGQAAGACGA